jgi:putative ABC transport system substrate-binding protein
MTTRRQILALAAGVLAARLAWAQPPAKRRIGFLAPLARSTPAQPDAYYDAFVFGMREVGYVEGRNLAIEWRFADGKFERLPALAAELVAAAPELIVTHSEPALRAIHRATHSIPVVFAVATDPVGSGFAASLDRPGGNMTGLSRIDSDPSARRLELLRTLVPGLARVAVLSNPDAAAHAASLESIRAATDQHGVKEILSLDARTPAEIDVAFGTMARAQIHGALVLDDLFFRGQRRQIATLALKGRLPVITAWREYVAVGGVMSYGQDIALYFRRAAVYVDKILQGATPGELPIDQPSKIHLAINRKAAAAIGLTVPRELLLRADEVIE